jgi:hypothetical protein
MADRKDRKYHDGKRISLQRHEVRYWCKALGCTARELALAARCAWAMRGAPYAWLVRNELRKADLRLKRGRRG